MSWGNDSAKKLTHGKKIPAVDPYTTIFRGAQDALNGDSPLGQYADWFGFGKGKGPQDTAHATDYLDTATHAYDGVEAPAALTAQAQTSSAGLSPQAQAAQTAQMKALSSLAANGGRSAASDANLAQIREQEGMQAQGMRGAVEQDAARRGMANGNSALLAKLSSNQAAQNTGAMQGAQVAGQQAQTALQAGQGAAGIGSGMQQQAMDVAAARDAMSRFNAGQDLSAQQYNSQAPVAAQLAKAEGVQKGAGMGSDYWTKKYGEDQKAKSGTLGGVMGAIGSVAAMSHGGEVPGHEMVSGDSLANDIVPAKGPGGSDIRLSAGEVVVPKSMRTKDPHTIADFVKHPPKPSDRIDNPHMKARLAALSHLGRK